MELPETTNRRTYSCPRAGWNIGWDWARWEAYIYSDEYDEYCFAPSQHRSTPSTHSTWGLDAKEVITSRDSGQFSCRCPAHEDSQASLRIRVLDSGKVLLRCWAGCDTPDVLEALGFGWNDVC